MKQSKPRAKFEKWAKLFGLDLDLNDEGEYEELDTTVAWAAWKGCYKTMKGRVDQTATVHGKNKC